VRTNVDGKPLIVVADGGPLLLIGVNCLWREYFVDCRRSCKRREPREEREREVGLIHRAAVYMSWHDLGSLLLISHDIFVFSLPFYQRIE